MKVRRCFHRCKPQGTPLLDLRMSLKTVGPAMQPCAVAASAETAITSRQAPIALFSESRDFFAGR